ncbi:thioredoxin domain-containing protein [Desulfolithobacter sp.]
MKKALTLCALLVLPVQAHALQQRSGTAGEVDWSIRTNWKLDTTPLDLVHTLDGKKVFVLGNDHKVHVYTAQGKKLGAIPVDKNISDIDIAPRGEMLYTISRDGKSFTAIDVSFTQNIDISGAPFLGPKNAPVTLVLFSDFECPYCAKVQPVLEQLLENNPETLKIAFKHLPLIRIHEYAEPAARAAVAAQNQGKFWQMHDKLFAAENLDNDSIMQMAEELGLNMKKFEKDMNSAETRARVLKDMRDAQQASVSGTPTMFINGHLIRSNSRSVLAIQKMIDRELARKEEKETRQN